MKTPPSHAAPGLARSSRTASTGARETRQQAAALPPDGPLAASPSEAGPEANRPRAAKPRLLIFVVAYFAEHTIVRVLERVPHVLLDRYAVEILVIDDGSDDKTFAMAQRDSGSAALPFEITVLRNPINQGYGGNQKIGYHYAIRHGFDFVALLHGDGQYAPECLPDLVEPLRRGEADAVFGSRMIHAEDALRGGMPLYKYMGNRLLTRIQNRLLRTHLSEFHSGYRIYSVSALQTIPFERNSNVFHFDTEIIIQLTIAGRRIIEVPIPTYYGDEICRVKGLKYAKDVIKTSLQARLQRANIFYDRRFDCAAGDRNGKYPSKLDFLSSHSRAVELIPPGASVLDLGSGSGMVGAALKERGCRVVGCDRTAFPAVHTFDRFFKTDLDAGLPDPADEKFDYILALDIIEHLRAPEEFLDQLRNLAARHRAQVIMSTANVAFLMMRLSLLLGRFEYSKRGILDLGHSRLYTFATLRRALVAAGFDIRMQEGIAVPVLLLLPHTPQLSGILVAVNRFLARLSPRLFGFEMLFVAEPRPTLETLLAAAQASASDTVIAPGKG